MPTSEDTVEEPDTRADPEDAEMYCLTDKNTEAGCGTVKGRAPRAKKSSAGQPRIGHSSRGVSTVDGQLGMATMSKPLSLDHWKSGHSAF